MAKSKTAGWSGKMTGGKSSTAIDTGSTGRSGVEKSVTHSRLHGTGSNEACYSAMKGNVSVRHKTEKAPPAPRGKSERGPGGFE